MKKMLKKALIGATLIGATYTGFKTVSKQPFHSLTELSERTLQGKKRKDFIIMDVPLAKPLHVGVRNIHVRDVEKPSLQLFINSDKDTAFVVFEEGGVVTYTYSKGGKHVVTTFPFDKEKDFKVYEVKGKLIFVSGNIAIVSNGTAPEKHTFPSEITAVEATHAHVYIYLKEGKPKVLF